MRTEFRIFGSNIKYVAIFTILGILDYVGWIFLLIGLLIFLLCLSNIININRKLNSIYLKKFLFSLYTALVLGAVRSVLAIIAIFLQNEDIYMIFYYEGLTIRIHQFAIPILVLITISGVLEMLAWQSFINFADQSSIGFPSYFYIIVKKGGKNLKNAALMYVLSFLIITVFIGWVFQIIGFLRLSNLEYLPYEDEEHQISSATVSETKRKTRKIDASFSKFENIIYEYLKEHKGKAFTFKAILNRVIDKLLDENEKSLFEINGEQILNQMKFKKLIDIAVKEGEKYYLIA